MTRRPALGKWFLRDMRINDRPPPVSHHFANGKACRENAPNMSQARKPRTKQTPKDQIQAA